jgi:hypothetical protein
MIGSWSQVSTHTSKIQWWCTVLVLELEVVLVLVLVLVLGLVLVQMLVSIVNVLDFKINVWVHPK